MEKIKASFDQKDRVVCVTVHGYHEFYYQPVGSKKRTLLFVTDNFSSSIFAYFRDKGRNMSDRGFSLTIKELYEFKKFYNHELAVVMKRIPRLIEYVIRECLEIENTKIMQKISHASDDRYFDRDDDERAA